MLVFKVMLGAMRITKIRVKNYRSVKDSDDIAGITKIFALIGRNNSGKSTILKAVQVLMGKKEVEVDDFHKNTDEPIEISVTLLKGSGDERKEVSLKLMFTKENLSGTCFIDEKQETKTKFNKELPELLCIDDIRNPNESTTGGQKVTLLNKILKSRAFSDNADEYAALSQKIENLKKRESEEVSEKISSKFQDITNERNFTVAIAPTVDLEKSVTYKTGLINSSIPQAKVVNILNSGTGLQSMYILALLEVWAEMSEIADETILLVEEPEVYLHPEYQRRMFAALRRIAENNQVIFTTHSPIMISDIWLTVSVRQVILNEKGETHVENVKIENVIDELGIRYEDVLNPSLVVFVEGKNDVKFFERVGIVNPKLKIIYTDGFRAIHYFAFIKIISSEHVSNQFIILADSDGENPAVRAQQLEKEIYNQFQTPSPGLKEKISGNILILHEYSIESYLLNAVTLKKSFPQLDELNLATFISEYKSKYQEKLGEVNAGTLKIDEFRKYLKPKLIFETIKVPAFDLAYRNFWSGQSIFLTMKDLIAARCADIEASGQDCFEYILSHSDIEAIPELKEKKEVILARIRGS